MEFIGEMLYGMQCGQDIKLSHIARALDEGILMKKTEERLSRHLDKKGLGEKVLSGIAREASSRIRKDTVIAIDPTDIRKLYAKKMPYLGKVRDGSDGGAIVNGYWACAAVACTSDGKGIVPLHLRLWSTSAPGHKSENEEIFETVKTIAQECNNRGIYTIDRGGDRDKVFDFFLDRQMRFDIRLVGNRHLLWGKKGKPYLAEALASKCRMLYKDRVEKENDKGEKKITDIEFGCMDVRLPHRNEPLRLVVVRGFGEKPMMLLTTEAQTPSRKSLWQAIYAYLCRWRVEDAIRYIKQTYSLEDVRVLSYNRLKNSVALVAAAAFFSCAWIGNSLRLGVLCSHTLFEAKRFFGIPAFHYYAISDGIAALLRRYGRWKSSSPPCSPDPQMKLNFSSA